jgi:hypothetical protein
LSRPPRELSRVPSRAGQSYAKGSNDPAIAEEIVEYLHLELRCSIDEW